MTVLLVKEKEFKIHNSSLWLTFDVLGVCFAAIFLCHFIYTPCDKVPQGFIWDIKKRDKKCLHSLHLISSLGLSQRWRGTAGDTGVAREGGPRGARVHVQGSDPALTYTGRDDLSWQRCSLAACASHVYMCGANELEEDSFRVQQVHEGSSVKSNMYMYIYIFTGELPLG